MMKNLRKKFDAWAGEARERYDRRQWILSKWENFEGVEWPEEKIALLVRHIRQGLDLAGSGQLLDAGCGGGWITQSLRQDGWVMTGVDISPNMLASARRGFPEGRWICAELAGLPFREESFERVLCYFVVINFQDPEYFRRSVQEIVRVMKPGGSALIGQIPDKALSAMYDRDKAEYLEYCRQHFNLGAHVRDQEVIPVNTFAKDQVLALARQAGARAEARPSFNPFYRPAAAQTVDWRFDLILKKH